MEIKMKYQFEFRIPNQFLSSSLVEELEKNVYKNFVFLESDKNKFETKIKGDFEKILTINSLNESFYLSFKNSDLKLSFFYDFENKFNPRINVYSNIISLNLKKNFSLRKVERFLEERGFNSINLNSYIHFLDVFPYKNEEFKGLILEYKNSNGFLYTNLEGNINQQRNKDFLNRFYNN